MIYGDPHILYIGTNGHVASFITPCIPNKWSNIVSDGGFQWNTVCRADALYFAGSWIKAGDHTISYMPFMDRGFLVGGANVKGDDCSTITPKAYACGIAAPAKLIVDGQEIDPAHYGSESLVTIVNDTANNAIIKAQTSIRPIDTYFGATPPSVKNYIAVYVKNITSSR